MDPAQNPTTEALLEVAVTAARRAGDLILTGLTATRRDLAIEKKGVVDLVTKVDLAAEEAIVACISSAFPDHSIAAEEGGGEYQRTGYQWLIDPLDGTTNFAHGHPHCAVSIAALHNGAPQIGVIYDAGRDELFSATVGGGAHLNERPMGVSSTDTLDHALLATGFYFDRRERADSYIPIFQDFMVVSQGIRRAGAAALDAAWVAAGRLDGFWEANLNPWDVAAGALLVTEAGGRVTNYDGTPFDVLEPARILASNGHIHDDMIDVLEMRRSLWVE